MREIYSAKTWFASIQWFFFIFANIIIIPITIAEAFGLSNASMVSTIQMSFIVTGLACLAQGILGHRRPILEGQSGLWWGIFLMIVVTASADGIALPVIGGSLALGVIISGMITILVGILGLGPLLAKLFKPGVMGVFVLLLGFTLIQIFLKGMFGVPFANDAGNVTLDLQEGSLAVFIVLLVIVISIKSSARVRSYALLIGIILGWIIHVLFFGTASSVSNQDGSGIVLFPLGPLTWEFGIVFTAVLAGLLNTSNTFGSLKGTDPLVKEATTKRDYVTTFSITGLANVAAGIFGLVPYAPYVSSIGYLRQTGIYDRLPFLIGSFLFFLMGVMPAIGAFFSHIPLSIGSAVLFVAYLQLFASSFDFFKQITLNSLNVYRAGIPIFVGVIIMMFPPSYFESIPTVIRPFMSNGLLVGIMLALLLENVIDWEKIGGKQ